MWPTRSHSWDHWEKAGDLCKRSFVPFHWIFFMQVSYSKIWEFQCSNSTIELRVNFEMDTGLLLSHHFGHLCLYIFSCTCCPLYPLKALAVVNSYMLPRNCIFTLLIISYSPSGSVCGTCFCPLHKIACLNAPSAWCPIANSRFVGYHDSAIGGVMA